MNKSLFERLLDFYHINYRDYLELTKEYNLSTFKGDRNFDDIDKAITLVREVIDKKGKIIIYGDYDADGIMGTSILVKMFQYLDVVVDYYIPNRYIDGYGLNMVHAHKYAFDHYDLVITVDNGITAFEPIQLLHDCGVKTLILDHHQAQDTVPVADAICHPTYSHFGEVASSGAFTAFIFSISLLNRVDKYLALLASISVISDMMPLLSYNRNLLRVMFKEYTPGEFKAIDLLADHEPLNETTIGMKIAPRINSIGRMVENETINNIIKYFITDDEEYILNYYSYIVAMNENRKNLSKFDLDYFGIDHRDKAVVIKGDFKEGVIGLVANTVMVKYRVPVVVFTKSIDGSLKGSARAPEGYDLVEIFSELSEYLLTSGGHSLAAGCSIKYDDFVPFKFKFKDIVSKKEVKPVEHPYIDINMSEINNENYELINSFSPFGESWPIPLFRLKHIKVDTLMYSKDHKHIITSLGNELKLVYFNYPELIEQRKFVDVVGTLTKKSYKGHDYIEFSCRDWIETEN